MIHLNVNANSSAAKLSVGEDTSVELSVSADVAATLFVEESEPVTLSLEESEPVDLEVEPVKTVEVPVGGTSDHRELTNRDLPNQHPMSAITGLDKALEGKLSKETDPTVPSWAKQKTKPSYTASEVGADPSGSSSKALQSAK